MSTLESKLTREISQSSNQKEKDKTYDLLMDEIELKNKSDVHLKQNVLAI